MQINLGLSFNQIRILNFQVLNDVYQQNRHFSHRYVVVSLPDNTADKTDKISSRW